MDLSQIRQKIAAFQGGSVGDSRVIMLVALAGVIILAVGFVILAHSLSQRKKRSRKKRRTHRPSRSALPSSTATAFAKSGAVVDSVFGKSPGQGTGPAAERISGHFL
jgi:flagellar basal body-associated protein FliL